MNLRVLVVLILIIFIDTSFVNYPKYSPEYPVTFLNSPESTFSDKVEKVTYNTTVTAFMSSNIANDDCDYDFKTVTIPYGQTVYISLEVNVSADQAWGLSSFRNSSNALLYQIVMGSEGMPPGSGRYRKETYTTYLSAGTYKLLADLCEAGLNDGLHYAKVVIRYNE